MLPTCRLKKTVSHNKLYLCYCQLKINKMIYLLVKTLNSVIMMRTDQLSLTLLLFCNVFLLQLLLQGLCIRKYPFQQL